MTHLVLSPSREWQVVLTFSAAVLGKLSLHSMQPRCSAAAAAAFLHSSLRGGGGGRGCCSQHCLDCSGAASVPQYYSQGTSLCLMCMPLHAHRKLRVTLVIKSLVTDRHTETRTHTHHTQLCSALSKGWQLRATELTSWLADWQLTANFRSSGKDEIKLAPGDSACDQHCDQHCEKLGHS